MLVAANHSAHREIIAAFEEALVALMALDHARAQAVWRRLELAIERHQAVEEGAFADWPALHPPRGASKELIHVEHARLRALLADGAKRVAALAALAALPPAAQHLALVRELDGLLRARHLLEHHGEREDRLVYPFLDAHLPADVARALAVALAASVEPAPGRHPS